MKAENEPNSDIDAALQLIQLETLPKNNTLLQLFVLHWQFLHLMQKIIQATPFAKFQFNLKAELFPINHI